MFWHKGPGWENTWVEWVNDCMRKMKLVERVPTMEPVKSGLLFNG